MVGWDATILRNVMEMGRVSTSLVDMVMGRETIHTRYQSRGCGFEPLSMLIVARC